MKKISVIIPVYNCEEYLHACLDSVVNQTIGIKNLEIIVINDGSTDNSLKILKEYAKKYKEIILINQDNKGLSVSRNIGVEKSNSEYITFLDSDDYLELNALEKMYNQAIANNNDLIIARLNSFNSLGKYGYYSDKYIKNKNNYQLKDYYNIVNAISVCSKLYKKELVKNIKFISNVKHEDNYFTLKVYKKAKSISNIEDYLYYRRIREGQNLSIMQNLNLDSFRDLLSNYQKFLNEENYENRIIIVLIKKANNYIFKNIAKEEQKNALQILEKFEKKYVNVKNKKDLVYLNIYNIIIKVICFLR